MLLDVEVYVQNYEMALFRDFVQKNLEMVLLGFSYAPKGEKMALFRDCRFTQKI